MWELWMHLMDTSDAYDDLLHIPLTFKWRKFQPQAIIFLAKKAYCWVGQDFWKKNTFFLVWDLVTTGKQIEKKLILPLKKYFKTLKDMIIGTTHLIFSKWVR